ncbi:MAG: hypothetical protein COA90_05365 [Gammaproteobacteria bacterium]|nr:MAG: hypothetical protein COA90_05365 [Gammaproteobacteria bacterium]
MILTAKQLASLNEMGIPVWQQRELKPSPAPSSTSSPVQNLIESRADQDSHELAVLSDEILASTWLILIDAEHYQQAEQRLLSAILLALELKAGQFSFITSEQVSLLTSLPEYSGKIVLVFGQQVASPLFNSGAEQGFITHSLPASLKVLVSPSLTELLNQPEHKAGVWNNLKLAQHLLQ